MECPFCRILTIGAADRLLQDRILLETANFAVLPAVGPLAAGHVLIISKQHTPGLATTGSRGIAEYESILANVCSHAGYSRTTILEAEHGSIDATKGPCIDHTHINIIPGYEQFGSMFDGHLEQIDDVRSLEDLPSIDAPYVFLRDPISFRAYNAVGVTSQLIRRSLFERIGRIDWDWAAFPRSEWLLKTLQMWESKQC